MNLGQDPNNTTRVFAFSLLTLLSIAGCNQVEPRTLAGLGSVDASRYGSIQQALRANPGRMVFVPAGEYRIKEPIKITTDGGGLYGFGTIIQENPDEHILVVKNARDVRIRDLTLTRPDGPWGKSARAVDVNNCRSVWFKDLKILNNRSTIASVELRNSHYCRVQGCEIINYKTITVDDRMDIDLYRYAFNAIDGHGIMVIDCDAAHIVRNHIIEQELRGTKEIQAKYELGKIVKRAAELGPLAQYGVEDGFAVIWHQGAGMRVTGKGADVRLASDRQTSFTLIDGNYIENAAQGLDLHTDHVVVTNNCVTNAYMGIKAMHGSRNVLITNNVFQAPGKYGILLRPGSGSHFAEPAEPSRPARGADVERGIIVANNIISDMGYGDEHWRLWNDDPKLSYPVAIKLGYGPLEKNPPMKDVIFEGNIVYDRGRDEVIVDGEPKVVPPRYKWAVWFDEKLLAEGFVFRGNIFHPGAKGVSNRQLTP